MEANHLNDHKDWRGKFASFLGMATIFLMVITAVTTVEFFNRLKENKYIGKDIPALNQITVSGQSERYVKPDLALIRLGVTVEAKTVGEAMEQNTEKINQIIDSLQNDFELAEEDLKTTQFSLSPRYEWREKEDYLPGERVLVGYEVNQSLELKVRDFEIIGALIQQAADLGANQIDDLIFLIEDEDSIRNEIRAEAIAQAKEKAEKLASELGVRLTRMLNFREEEPVTYRARGAGGIMYDDESMEIAPATPSIQSGQNKVEVNVSITYEIN